VWEDPEKSAEVGRELARARELVAPWVRLGQALEDIETLMELAVEEEDEATGREAETALRRAQEELRELELQTLYSGPFDQNNAVMAITAGAGGTDAADWAEMLLRMYRLWAEHHGRAFTVVSFVPGDSAGLRNATVRVEGVYAYGRLKAEAGVHRLVRLSPFDAAHRRHTSFASVDVVPEIGEDVALDLREEDLRVDTFRSSGAGGQHVNKTDSAVRITHLPTGITVQCQNERSQHANRRTAIQILRARLYDAQRSEMREEIDRIRGERKEISFASQIRSYVLHPYTMVKDLRTGVEVGSVQAVLDGDIDQFIDAYLQQQVAQGGEE